MLLQYRPHFALGPFFDCNIILSDMASNDAGKLPIQVFKVSHQFISMQTEGQLNPKKGRKWNIVRIRYCHCDDSNCDSVSFPKTALS